jgi:DTW domain-containing protein YfiP/acyl-coenzyme A thioesterase PaaI-like protein
MAAARSVAGDPTAPGATVDLAIHYLDPARGEAVVVDGVVTRRGRDIVFVEARVTSASGTPIARSTGVVRLGDVADASATPSAPACPLDAATRLVPRVSGSAFTARLGVLNAPLAPGHAVMVLARARRSRRRGRRDARGRARRARRLLRCGAAAWSIDGFDPRGPAATIGMHLSFDRTPADEDVVVEARTSWRAAGIFLNTVVLTGADERPARSQPARSPTASCGRRHDALPPLPQAGAALSLHRPRAMRDAHPRRDPPASARARMKMGTARLAHLGLAGPELHVGVRFDDHPRVTALAADPGTALLYPGPDAVPVDEVREPPRTLVVVDGTWFTARKIVDRNPCFAGLPRIAIRPVAPSAYRIRSEPAPHCLATVEAIVLALEALEGDGARFDALRAAFARLVETQLAHATERRYRIGTCGSAGAAGSRARSTRCSRRASTTSCSRRPRATRTTPAGPHELVPARRGAAVDGRALHAPDPAASLRCRPGHRIGWGSRATHSRRGCAIDDARAAWRAFLRPDDVLVGWGTVHAHRADGRAAVCPSWIDLRGEVGRRLGRKPGGTRPACDAFGTGPADPWAPGRGGRRLAELAELVTALRAVDRS